MFVEIFLVPLIGLLSFGPTAESVTCDRLVAAGEFTAAAADCAEAGIGIDAEALELARVGDLVDRSTEDGVLSSVAALAEARKATAAAPQRIVEEAIFQHFARVVRSLTPLDQRPELAQWPLPDLPVPGPKLPELQDAEINQLTDAIRRSDERIRNVEARLAGLAPGAVRLPPQAIASLSKSLDGLYAERSRLTAERVEALEKLVESTRYPKPDRLLHLAATYLDLDRGADSVRKRRRRGRRVLKQIRRWYATTNAAGIAALFLAGFALDDGNEKRARPLLNEAGLFDPALTAFFDALLQWRLGEHEQALKLLGTVKGDLTPLLSAHVAALEATIFAETGDPFSAVEAWERVVRSAPADQARRARLNAAIAWSDAVERGEDASKVPPGYRRNVLIHALSRGRQKAFDRVLDAIFETASDPLLPQLGLMRIDDLRARGEVRAADILLARLTAACAESGKWRSANIGQVATAARTLLRDRLAARVEMILETNVPLPPGARSSAAPVVDAWLSLVELSDRRMLTTATGLGRLGFLEQARGPLERIKAEATDPLIRREAAQALVDAMILRAREAGMQGAPTGRWLGGKSGTGPMPPSVSTLVEALTDLISQLPLNSAERDSLLVDRATIRVDRGPMKRKPRQQLAKALDEVANRHIDKALGLRAIYLRMRLSPKDVPKLAQFYAERNAGPAARNRVLRLTLEQAFEGAGERAPRAQIREGRFVDAAQAFDALASQAQAEPDVAGAARLGAAVCWTMALRPIEAEQAWRRFVTLNGAHPQAPIAYIHLAKLLQTQGRLDEAAKAYIASAGLGGPDGSRALLRAIRLLSADFVTLLQAVEQFARDYPDHPEAERFRRAEVALQRQQAPDTPVAGPSAAEPIGLTPCQGEACRTATFWVSR